MFAHLIRRLAATTRPSARRPASRRSRPSLEMMEARQLLTTLVIPVTSIGDNGNNAAPLANTLRSAIVQANKAAAGTSVEIDFKITGGGPQTISLAAPLPSLTHQVYLNGTTESGYAGTPLVGLDGTNAGGGVVGLDFLAGASNSTVTGIEVDAFNGGGVLIDGAHGVTLSNDYFGVHTLAIGGALRYPVGHGNGTFGVELTDGTSGNILTGDVVSSNQYNGVVITHGSSGNTVTNSKIGTDPTGTLSVQNNGVSFGNGIAGGGGSGIVINGGSANNAISNDVISDNHDWGVFITDPGTIGNVLTGDEIGTDIHGTTSFANHVGILIANGAQSNVVGKSGLGDVISGNASDGVEVIGSGTNLNVVQSDRIGTNAAGTAAIANLGSGVSIAQGAQHNTVSFDVISGNTHDGVFVSDPDTSSNTISSDDIGTDAAGKHAVPNQWGVLIQNGASGNVVGGANGRDVISGNSWTGVELAGANTSNNIVSYDYIGTDSTGSASLGNAGAGVAISQGASFDSVYQDVIAGSGLAGVWISASSDNFVTGDLIGTDATGEHALANAVGVELLAGSTYNVIGGPTSLAGERDVISGNAGDGVQVFGAGTNSNFVEGDYIGTDAGGATYLPNAGRGVAIYQAASSNVIGGPLAIDRDIISGNGQDGVLVSDPGTSNNTVQYDYIGTDSTGELAISNQVDGVVVQNGAYATNVVNDEISGNLLDGVLVQDAGTLYTSVNFDWIGLDATGTRSVKNSGGLVSNDFGVLFTNGAYDNSASSDVIAGNTEGVMLTNGADYNWINNDKIGTNVAGTAGVPNTDAGIFLDGAFGNQFVNDLICFNKGNGLFGEGGSNDQNNTVQATYTVTVNGVTFTNGQNPTDFD